MPTCSFCLSWARQVGISFPKHRRLRQFLERDYDLLLSLLAGAKSLGGRSDPAEVGAVLVTPNTLTEASNLLEQHRGAGTDALLRHASNAHREEQGDHRQERNCLCQSGVPKAGAGRRRARRGCLGGESARHSGSGSVPRSGDEGPPRSGELHPPSRTVICRRVFPEPAAAASRDCSRRTRGGTMAGVLRRLRRAGPSGSKPSCSGNGTRSTE